MSRWLQIGLPVLSVMLLFAARARFGGNHLRSSQTATITPPAEAIDALYESLLAEKSNANLVDASLAVGKFPYPHMPSVLQGHNFTKENLMKWFTLRTEKMTDPAAPTASPPGRLEAEANSNNGLNPIELVNVGKQIWDIVQDNKGVVNLQTDFATAVPKSTSWQTLPSWKDQSWDGHSLKWKNAFGVVVCEVDWKYTWGYSGEYVRPTTNDQWGRYVTEGAVQVKYAKAAWGFTTTATAKPGTPKNVGSQDKVLAELSITASTQCHGLSDDVVNKCVYFRGDASGKEC